MAKDELGVNQLAELFPLVSEERLQEMAEDIDKNGMAHAIQLDAEGDILDGRNRYEAWKRSTRIHPLRKKRWKGPPTQKAYAAFIMSENVMRRDLTVQQRAQIAVKLNEAIASTVGRPKSDNEWNASKTTAEIANEAGVSERSVRRARQVANKGEEIEQEVIDGTMSAEEALETEEDDSGSVEWPTDCYGNELPEYLFETFARADELNQYRIAIQKIARDVEAMCKAEHASCGWMATQIKTCKLECKNAATAIKFSLPHCLCSWCGGDRCDACKQTGWLPKEVYDRVPEDNQWEVDE